MAPTLRLDPPVSIFSTGRSGALIAQETARCLHEHGVEAAVTEADSGVGAPVRWPTRGLIVLCCGGPRPELEHALHDQAARGGARGLPVVLEHPLLRVGPIAEAGAPCSQCLERRRRQLARDGRVEDLWRAFHGAGGEPRGVLPHELALAAALAVDDLTGLLDGTPARGRVRWFDVQDLRVAADHVVGVHGCPRCGGQAGPSEERTWSALSGHATAVLAERGTTGHETGAREEAR